MSSPEQRLNLHSFSKPASQANIESPLILVVEDNEDNLLLMSEVLLALDCSFITTKEGRAALFMAQHYQPKLILLDILLPDIHGVEVVRSLKQNPETMTIPIVAVTALARAEDREGLLFAGCNDYISKPYVIDELEALIDRYLN
ncbi:response regulator [Coleofasciculus sp. FACHB-SPT9]|uniref:response regulator n=1 Tax=Cyanophyceae TaxID=3028117 RepID=UPI0016873EA3|nr:response regulator [Coleofasciculus sp. FACHB-SPT9]MBD1889969.1 response regulator [Coleofasciculus sp. FACHB-SPT9]